MRIEPTWNNGGVADQEDRHEESFATEDTRYERELEAERRRRNEAAQRLEEEPLPEPVDE